MPLFIVAFAILELHSRVIDMKVLLETGENVGKNLLLIRIVRYVCMHRHYRVT